MADPTLQFGSSDDLIYKDVSANDNYVFQINNTKVVEMSQADEISLSVTGPIQSTNYHQIEQNSAPTSTTDKLYNVGGDLFWNGSNLSQSANGLIQDAGGDTSVTTEAVSDTLIFTTDGVERMRISSNGYIGIGTDVQLAPFDMRQGDMLIGVTSIQFDYARGNLGLGVTNPNSQLHMERALKFDSYLHEQDTTNKLYAVGNDLFWNQQNVIGSGASIQNNDVSNDERVNTDDATYPGEVTIETNQSYRLRVQDGAIIPHDDDTYDLGSTANRFRHLYVGGDSINIDNSVIGNNGSNLVFFTGNNERVKIAQDGNVGVGTAAPDARMNIVNSASENAFHIEKQSADGVNDAANSTVVIENSNQYPRIMHKSADASIGAVYNLEANKDLYLGEASDARDFLIRGTSVKVTEGENSYFQTDLGVSGALYPNQIGVGKAIGGGYKIDADGNVNLSDTYAYFIDGNNVLAEDTLGGTVVNSSLTNLGTLSALNVAGPIDFDGTATVRHIVPESDDTYDLGATGNRFRNLYLGGDSLIIDGSVIGNNDNNIVIFTNGSQRMEVGKDGNVGVGVENPDDKLVVGGNVKFNGAGDEIKNSDNSTRLSQTTLGASVLNSSLENLGTLTALSVTGPTNLNGGDVSIGENLTVSGNLNVLGTTFQLDTEQIVVSDPMIKLAANNQADTFDTGFYGLYQETGVSKYRGMIHDASEDKFFIFDGTTTDPGPTEATALTDAYYTFGVGASARLGIGLGVTNPSEALEVLGTMKSDDLELNGADIGFNADLKFSSGGVGGTERARIESATGDMGVGTAAPTSRLHVEKDTTDPIVLVKPVTDQGFSSAVEIQGARQNSSSLDNSALHFTNFDNQGPGRNFMGTIAGKQTDTVQNYGDMCFYTYPDGDTKWLRMNITSQGQVGMGVTSPTERLEVDGNLNLTDGNNFNIDGNLIINETTIGSSVVNSNLTSVGTLTSLDVTGDLTVDTNVLKVDTANNRVGINSTNPSQALDVDGDALIQDGNLYLFNTDEKIQSDGSEMTFHVGGSERAVIDASGNVGIGTTDPDQRLEVAGNLKFNGASDEIQNEDGATRLSKTTLGASVVNSSLTNLGTLTALNVAGPIDFDGTATVRDIIPETDDTYDLGATGSRFRDLYLGGDSINLSGTVIGNDNNNLKVFLNGSEQMRLETAGRLIIGNSLMGVATEALEVDGNAELTSGGAYRIDGVDIINETAIASSVVSSNLQSVGTLNNLTVGAGDLIVDTNTFYVDATNDSVMVGITEAATGSKLHIHNASADTTLRLTNGNTDSTNLDGFEISVSNSSSEVTIEQREVAKMLFKTAGNDSLTFAANGNVGIGSTAPAHNVDIEGNVNIDAPSEYRIGGSSVLSATTLGSGVVNSSLTSVDSVSGLTSLKVSGNSDLQGNADIGGNLVVTGDLTVNGTTTTVDTQTLTVDDPMFKLASNNMANSLDIGFYGLYVDTGVTRFTGLIKDASADKYFLFDGAETEPGVTQAEGLTHAYVTFDTANARVGMGLGVTAPAEALHVSGTIKGDDLELSSEIGYSTDLQFSSGGVGGTERMRITTGGNVGIGTNNPDEALEINGNLKFFGAADEIQNDDGATRLSKTTLGASVVNSSLTNLGTLSALNVSGASGFGGPTTPLYDVTIGDDNTGINGDSEDVMAFYTGGAERMTVYSDGNVGIGSDIPSQKLDVNGDALFQGGTINLVNTNNRIDVSSNVMTFDTNGAERARIDASGNVGIGTNTAGADLHLRKAAAGADVAAIIENSSTTGQADAKLLIRTAAASDGDAHLELSDNSTTWSFGVDNSESSKLRIGRAAVASNEDIVIDTSGNVGVGTTVPGQKFDVNGVGAFRTSLAVGGNFTPASIDLAIGDANSGLHGAAEDELQILTGGAERMRFDAAGLVGVGGVDPAVDFHLEKTTVGGDVAMRIKNADSSTGTSDALLRIETVGQNANPHIELATADQTWALGVDNSDSDKLKLGLGGVDSNQTIIIDTSSNVGIGSDPGSKLSVLDGIASSTTADVLIEGKVSSGHAFMALETNVATDDSGILLKTAGTYQAAIFMDESADLLSFTTHTSVDSDANRTGNKKMTINAANGNVAIGTDSSTLAKLYVNGDGSSSAVSYGFLNSSGGTGTNSTTTEYSIGSSGRIRASEFNAISDRRVKTNLQESDYQSDLEKLTSLKTYSYEYIDQKFVKKGVRKGLIAQEVEEVFETSVNKCSDFIPNIYKVGYILDEGKSIKVTYEASQEIAAGKTIKVMIYKISDDEGETAEFEIESVEEEKLVLKAPIDLTKYHDELFVIGSRVDDFRNVSNDDILFTSVSAIKALKQENDVLKTQIADILSRLQTLEQA